jgi:hypothetical protein
MLSAMVPPLPVYLPALASCAPKSHLRGICTHSSSGDPGLRLLLLLLLLLLLQPPPPPPPPPLFAAQREQATLRHRLCCPLAAAEFHTDIRLLPMAKP